jgi:multimeric flavodoxin WrbA
MTLSPTQQNLCRNSSYDFSALKAVFINCTLKPSPEVSHTEGLMEVSKAIMQEHAVAVTSIRAVDHDIAFGVYPDMREHGFKQDVWPDIWPIILEADILVIGSPIWLGQISAVCSKIIQRLYGMSAMLNDKGQWIYYGKTGGCVITGNEDGISTAR